MKHYLAAILGLFFTVAGIAPSASGFEPPRRDLSKKHHHDDHHDRDDWQKHDQGDRYGRQYGGYGHSYGRYEHRRSRREYRRGHYTYRHGRRIWIAPRSVVVYF